MFKNILVPLLQQIIEAAKHSELLRRVEYQLDELARAHHQAWVQFRFLKSLSLDQIQTAGSPEKSLIFIFTGPWFKIKFIQA